MSGQTPRQETDVPRQLAGVRWGTLAGVCGLFLMAGFAIIFLATFAAAFATDGTVTLDFTVVGELYWEAALFFVGAVGMLWGWAFAIDAIAQRA